MPSSDETSLIDRIHQRLLEVGDVVATHMPRPVRSGWAFVRDVDLRFRRTHSILAAAAVAFYGIVSLTPLGIIAVAALAHVTGTRRAAVARLEDVIRQFSSEEAARVLDQADALLAPPNRAVAGILGALSLLWAASRLFETLVRALNSSWPDAPDHGFLRRKLVGFVALVAAGIGLAAYMVAASAAVTITGWMMNRGVPNPETILPRGVPDLLISVPFAVVAFWLIYKFLPNRTVGNWAAGAGAITATVGLVVSRPIFTMFISSSERSRSLYGSLLSVVVFAMWMYVVAQLVLWGSHVAAQVDGAPMPRAPSAADERPELGAEGG